MKDEMAIGIRYNASDRGAKLLLIYVYAEINKLMWNGKGFYPSELQCVTVNTRYFVIGK